MNLNQGDEGAIVVQYVYARLRDNAAGLEVAPMPHAPEQSYPCIGFSLAPAAPSTLEQGGDVLYSTFQLTVLVVGEDGSDDLQPIRTAAKEAAAALWCHSGQPGTLFGPGRVLNCTQYMPLTFSDRDAKGTQHWHIGHVWTIKVQPDETAR